MKKRTLFRFCFALFLTAVMILSVLPEQADAVSSSEIKEELNELKSQNAEIQAQINGIRRQYNANASQIQELVDNKNAIDQEIALLHTQIININEQISVYNQLIADNQEELEVSQDYLDRLNEQSKERIQAMEEEGDLSYWEVIFRSSSFTDMLDRLTMVEEIAAADQRRLEDLEAAARMVRAIQEEMAEEKQALEESQTQLAQSQTALEERREESDGILRELAKKQDEFQALLDESEALQDDLMKQIAKKEKEYSNAKYQEELARQALQGQNPKSDATWITPVSGYKITSPFGMRKHPILGYNKMHNGIDMACAQGTPIYATRAGTVTAASYQAGGAGNYVSINHGDGFASIYMHMTHYVVSAGQNVSAGQLIGYVGSTGLSTGPHLHFGISYAGTYVNPLAYI